ncbi:MAG: alpha/beta hydrolase, partial [Planctomycetes bacterium]|nr:alpha/beta hydrolase [Planctomycetota bacterium]
MLNKSYILILLLLLVGCVERPFYQPTRKIYRTPSEYGLKFENVHFKSKDGTLLNGWFIPAQGEALGTVIQFHGNAQNMSSHFTFAAWLPKNKFNLFVFDYRGYGKSQGVPSREGVYQDSFAALEYLVSRKDIDKNKIIVLGQSLGGANAIAVLGKNRFPEVKGIIIDSAFYSYKKVASDALRHTSVGSIAAPISSVMVSDKYQPLDAVKNIKNTPK